MPNKLRDWFAGTPHLGFFSSPSTVLLWMTRGVFVALSIGIATSAMLHFDEVESRVAR